MSQWRMAWGYIPVNWGTEVAKLEDITQKVWIRNNLDGKAVKIKFTNQYGINELALDHVTIGRYEKESERVVDIKTVTYQQKERIILQPGTSFYSDSIPYDVKKTDDLVISLYIKSGAVHEICQTWSARSWKSQFFQGDHTECEQLQGMLTTDTFPFAKYDQFEFHMAAGICGLQILTDTEVTTVACFGDSITHMSYYFDSLLETLYEAYPGKIVLYNCGIGGNRILYDDFYVEKIPGHGTCFGKSAVSRFEQDVFGDTDPDIIFFMEGINDCTHGLAFQLDGEIPDGTALLHGIKKLIAAAHKRNSKFYVSTIMPFGCYEEVFRDAAEKIRQEFNNLLRENQSPADGFIDLDAIMRKTADTGFMREGMHLGDGVHLNQQGGEEVAKAIAETFFLKEERFRTE